MNGRLTPRLVLLLTLPPLLWAANAVVGRLMVGHVPPLLLNAARWLLAALLLAPLARGVWRDLPQLRERWVYLLAIGTLGVGSFNALQYLALVTSTPLNVTLIYASMPLWIALVGALAFGQRPTAGQLVGSLLSLAGVATVILRGTWQRLADLHFVAGDGYMLAAVVGWALYSWLLARPPASMRPPQRPDWDWSSLLMVQILFGLPSATLAAAGEALFTAQPAVDWTHPGIWPALGFIALGPSLVAYRCWGAGVEQAGPTLAAFFVNLSPLFAALMSATLLGELPQGFHALAFVLIVSGIAVSTRGAAR